ncbi:hypothetical protein [Rhizobium ruizarguesonis]|uniref:hypothetical protein n=1 Tax=Rhizobium ruizarguesonis TaxID=2081791 RepID=UPI0014465A20|nr:hypothetical protein [Rhizobium ruizarguesonis]NKQ88698.1 hypothetical protein [Rhizobium ruizarguesonis]
MSAFDDPVSGVAFCVRHVGAQVSREGFETFMAFLPESFKAFRYQTGIDRICDAYRASADTMSKALRDAAHAYSQYEQAGIDDAEYDEDGILLGSTAHSLAQAEMDAILAVSVVREAFVTSAFHYWERSARAWTRLHGRRDHFGILSAESAKIYPISPQLDNLNRLNNLLKHNSHRIDQTLVDTRPDYFAPLFPSANNTSPQRLRLRLLHEHVEEAFDIVRASGPTY